MYTNADHSMAVKERGGQKEGFLKIPKPRKKRLFQSGEKKREIMCQQYSTPVQQC